MRHVIYFPSGVHRATSVWGDATHLHLFPSWDVFPRPYSRNMYLLRGW